MTWRRLAFRTLALLAIAAFFAAFVAIFYPSGPLRLEEVG